MGLHTWYCIESRQKIHLVLLSVASGFSTRLAFLPPIPNGDLDDVLELGFADGCILLHLYLLREK